MDEAKLRKAVDILRRQRARGVFPGGQLAVRCGGKLVVDEAVGTAREGVPFTPETRSCVFSAGKPIVAIAMALLEDRGTVDPSRPVAAYWPEFAAEGKADITVLDVLLHRSGLYVRDIEADWRHYGDWNGVTRRIAASKPRYARGTLAYQPMGFGWILGEIIRRVANKRIDRFLAEDVLAPAGITGLDLGAREEELPSLARSYWVDDGPPKLAGEVLEGFEEAQNSKEQLTALLPGAGTVGTARALSAFYAWLLEGTRTSSGAPLVRAETLTRYITPQTRGRDKTVGFPMVLGRGFGMGWFWPFLYGWWRTGRCYGHAGNFSTVAWADPDTGAAVAIVTNGNRAPSKLIGRFAPIGSTIRAACK